jgi:hypothetical protein
MRGPVFDLPNLVRSQPQPEESKMKRVFMILGWIVLAVVLALGVVGSLSLHSVSKWIAFIFWSGLLVLWIREGWFRMKKCPSSRP